MKHFDFLFETEKLKSLNTIELKESCKFFEKMLQNCHIPNIDVEDLFNEVELLQKHLALEYNTVNKNTKFLKKNDKHLSIFLPSIHNIVDCSHYSCINEKKTFQN